MNPDPFESAGHRLWVLMFRWLLNAVSVWAAASLVRGIGYEDWASLLAAALILGILNALVKPFLIAVALPLVVLTLGFMLLLINAFLLMLTSKLVPGFHVAGFWPAIGASVIISLVSMLLGNQGKKLGSRRSPPQPAPAFKDAEPTRSPPPGKGPIIDV